MTLIDDIIAEHHIAGAEQHELPLGDIPGLRPPEWIADGPVYEVFLRVCPPDNDFHSLQQRIPHLRELGIKTIWLLPIHPVGIAGRKGSLGSPYAVKDFFAIDPAYGDAADFKALICEIHHYDMKIILDLVANHGAIDSQVLQEHQEMIRENRSVLAAPWTDIEEFDYTKDATRAYMRDVMKYWIKEFDVDGFRCDSAGLIPLDYWAKMIGELSGLKEDLFMLAEWEGAGLHQEAFHATYDWSLYALLADVHQGRRQPADLITLVEQKRKSYPQLALPLRFTENHDYQRTRELFGDESFYPYAAFVFMVYGIPSLFAGQEYGSKILPSLFDQNSRPEYEQNAAIFDFYRRLIQVRQESAPLRSRTLNLINRGIPQRVLAFEKQAGSERILVALNFGDKTAKMFIPHQYRGSVILDFKSGAKNKTSEAVELAAYDVFIIYQKSAGIS